MLARELCAADVGDRNLAPRGDSQILPSKSQSLRVSSFVLFWFQIIYELTHDKIV